LPLILADQAEIFDLRSDVPIGAKLTKFQTRAALHTARLDGRICYLFPSIIAAFRGHHNTLAIFLLNLFLGWTGLG